jgi:hypothetical protein
VAGEVDPLAVDGGADQAGAGRDLQPGQAAAAQAPRPVRSQGGVGAAGDRVLGEAAGGCEVAGDEVIAVVQARRGGGGDDPADAAPGVSWVRAPRSGVSARTVASSLRTARRSPSSAVR